MKALLLGPFELRRDDAVVELGDPQQRLTLAVLLSHANRPVSTDRLTDIVWAGQKRPKSNLLAGYVSRLRKAFENAGAPKSEIAIDRTPTGYLLRINPDDIDAVRFDELCDQARAAGQARAVERRHALLREAIALWRGRYLEDLDIDRVDVLDPLGVEDKFIDALGDLAELELGAGNHRWVRDRLRSVVTADPTRQRLAALLIRALIANGDRVQAVERYHAVREALDEYGMETEVELRRLARLAHHVDDCTTLPEAPRFFAGRTQELARITRQVDAALSAQRSSTIWISGMPGVGKTGLALRAAHHLRDRFPDGQIFLQLNGFTPNVPPVSTNDALAQLLRDLGIPPERIPRAEDRKRLLYLSTLAGSRTMVLLDNAISEDQVRPLLPAVPGCLALITSRRVGGVAIGDAIQVEPLVEEHAAELFRDLVGDDRRGAELDGVRQAVRLCGRLPLSITLVASQLRLHNAWDIEHLVTLLRDGAAWQPHGRFAVGNRLAYQVSYDQLSDEQRYLFRLFGRIPAVDIGVPAVSALLDHAPHRARMLLEELLEVSLVTETGNDRYLMLDPLREFAATIESASADDDTAAALDRLLDFYLVTAAGAMRAAFPFDRDRLPGITRVSAASPEFIDAAAARAWLSEERANLLAAIRFAASNDRPEHVWQLAVILWRWHYARGQIEDWTETLDLARRTIASDRRYRRGLAHVVLRLAGARRQGGQPAHALELAAQALSLWRELDDGQGQAAALCTIALVEMDRSNLPSAVAHFESALALFESIGDRRGQANALDNLGQLNELQGDLELAERRQRTAVALLTELDHTQGLAHALDNLGLTRQRLGRVNEALTDHERARELAAQIGDRAGEAYALNNIGNAHRRAGDAHQALVWHDKARAIADEIADPLLRMALYLDRGDTMLSAGDATFARLAYLAALDLATPLGDRGHQARANHGVARALHTIGDHDDALPHWHAAESAYAQLGRREESEISRERAALTCACSLPEK
jgi:DNA-binding SARP family transcriptional activator/tetratricopeptide (TPR) repeat protein